MKYLGEFTAGKTVICRFNTHQVNGNPITLAGIPVVSVYKNNTTESTAGVTLTVDYDSRTGLHHVAIDTSADGTFYAAGNDFDVVITTGTVDSTSVVGTVVGTFSILNRALTANTITHLNQIYDTDYATVYDATNKAFQAKLGNFARGGSSLALTTGAIACTTITATFTGDLSGKVLGGGASSLSGIGVQADLQTIKTQTVTCPGGVAVGAFVGNATHALVVDNSGFVTVITNNDKAGYSLTQGFPANFSSLGISAAGKINEVVLVDTLTTYTGDVPQTGNCYPAVSSTGVVLADGAITDAKITFPAESAGRPTTFLAAMRRVWEWACNKRTRDRSSGTVLLRNAADNATLETQTQSTSGTSDAISKGV